MRGGGWRAVGLERKRHLEREVGAHAAAEGALEGDGEGAPLPPLLLRGRRGREGGSRRKRRWAEWAEWAEESAEGVDGSGRW